MARKSRSPPLGLAGAVTRIPKKGRDKSQLRPAAVHLSGFAAAAHVRFLAPACEAGGSP